MGWILPIGEASAGEGLRLQPAQQVCFMSNIGQITLVELTHFFVLVKTWGLT